jgi:hypothetical protein
VWRIKKYIEEAREEIIRLQEREKKEKEKEKFKVEFY